MEIKEEKLEERKAIIVIGMISSGKSTFLNSLLGINYLETKDDITTKFICIIRYNNEINEPKFCHLKIREEEKGKYYFIKDGEESIGKDKIIEKISNINLKESSITQPQYDQLFYLLETNITNIENKDFLKKHDFYDIPGLNEYISEDKKEEEKEKENEKKEEEEEKEKEDKNEIDEEKNIEKPNKNKKEIEESKENMKYIKGIFKYIKTKIERQIIILNTETYYKPQNLQIIKEIKKELNVPLEYNLIILNKIDKSPNPNKTIEDCRAFFINNIDSSILNFNSNIFIALDSRQFKNEMLMKKDFENFFYIILINIFKNM